MAKGYGEGKLSSSLQPGWREVGVEMQRGKGRKGKGRGQRGERNETKKREKEAEKRGER